MLTLADHIDHLETVADLYEPRSGSDRLDILSDILADALHWCAAHEVDFKQALTRARYHFLEERLEAGLD